MVSQTNRLILFGLLALGITIRPIVTNHTAAQESFVDQCTPVPTWNIGRGQAVRLVGQNITVIALLNSSIIYGRKQAAMLNSLRSRLYQGGFPAINFMVINSMLATEDTELLRHEAANIPVYQEQPGETVRGILGVPNNQILVLDRCGRLAYQVISPFSKLTYPYVKAAILSTYKDNLCGFCNATNHEHDAERAEDVDTSLVYVSDAPDHDDGKFINLQNESIIGPQEDSMSMEALHAQTENRSLSQAPGLSQKENGLGNLFIPNLGGLNAQRSPSTDDTLKMGKGNITFKHQLNTAGKPLALTMRKGSTAGNNTEKDLDQQGNYLPHESHQDVKNERNWSWFGMVNNQNDLRNGSSTESDGQSVEVVHHIKHSKRKKRRKSRKRSKEVNKETATVFMDITRTVNYSTECTASSECAGVLGNTTAKDSSSTAYTPEVNESLERYVNDTQKLLDWYQKETEQYILDEERSNILKRKLIEHYSKFIPWLTYRLAPENEH